MHRVLMGGNTGLGGQQRGGGGGNRGGGSTGGSQPLRTALHTISISISLQNSLSCETELKGSKST